MTTYANAGAESGRQVDWQAWQDSWDRQQQWHIPDREERFRVMLDMVEALVGPEPAVLDLACGTGSISDRVLRRFPGAHCTGVDLDPALLAIARGHFAGEHRVSLHTADLGDPGWVHKLPHRTYDAVLTSTALHWMSVDQLPVLYGEIAGVLREGGVFLNADHMPEAATPRINEALHAFDMTRRERELERAGSAGADLDWAGWWQHIGADPALADVVAERHAVFGDPALPGGDHGRGSVPLGSAAWHAETLCAAGFAEARQVWTSPPREAMVLGLR